MLSVIFKQDNGQVAILSPTPQVLEQLGGGIEAMMKIAVKDVPAGKPFKILENTELPQDIDQEYWVVDDADLNDGIGGEFCEFCQKDLDKINGIGGESNQFEQKPEQELETELETEVQNED